MDRRFVLAFFIVAQVALVCSHGSLKVPQPRPVRSIWQDEEPIFGLKGPKKSEDYDFVYSSTAMRCRDATTFSPITTLTAGRPFSATWSYQSCDACNHVGDCAFYISYDTNKVAPQNWVKIAQFPGCAQMKPGLIEPPFTSHTFAVPVPQYLPSCDHCVLRWEWVGVQDQAATPTPEIEYYANCVDVKIVGVAGTSYPLPSPTVAISGIEHLPNDPKKYRDAYGEWDPWVPQIGHKYVAGPSLWTCAQPAGFVNTGTGTPTPAAATCPLATPTAARLVQPSAVISGSMSSISFTLVMANSLDVIQANRADFTDNLRFDLSTALNVHPSQIHIGAIQNGQIGGTVNVVVYILPASTTTASAGAPAPRDVTVADISTLLSQQYADVNSSLLQGSTSRTIVSDNSVPRVTSVTVTACGSSVCPPTPDSPASTPNIALIAGVVGGVVAFIVIVAVVVVVVRRRKAAAATDGASLRPADAPMSHA
eukprot:TRINITY_DN204_c0_g1_i3.p1 TRINITY_DN204_c0_g1~~TRINITY_DN204_c0_g1_i3.p1  ORF type:complete len:499 (+),score=197.23 TRINITY_DN204_c0_g1_i3:60-1499(+)